MPVKSGSKVGGGTTVVQKFKDIAKRKGSEVAMAYADQINDAIDKRKKK